MTITLASEIVLRFTFWVCVLSPVQSLWWPWWKSAVGITVMAEAMGFAVLLLPAELHYVFGLHETGPGWQWFSLICFAGLPLTLLWRAAAIYAVQRRGAR